MRKYLLQIALFIIPLLLLTNCNNNKWEIGISEIETNQVFKEFDKNLFSIDTDSIWDAVPELEKEYGNFFAVYNTYIIKVGSTNQLDYDTKLIWFLTDPDISSAYNESNKQINRKSLFSDIELAFKHYHYYYPNKIVPAVYTHVSGFNQSIVIDTNYLSISVDKYLGANSKYYKMLRTPMYKRNNMYPKKITSDVMLAWAETEFTYNNETESLINKMIYYGKLQVFTDAMLPTTADTTKLGFTIDQLNWCKKNEKQMWVYLVENKLLFSTAYKDVKKYINEGPFTSTFSKESPARTGRWIGYQIVISYLKANPKTTLPQLMEMNNYQEILNQSKYKP